MYCKRYVEGNAGGSTIIQADYGKVYLSVYTTPLFVVDCLDTSGERVPRGNFSAYQSTVTPGTTIHRCYCPALSSCRCCTCQVGKQRRRLLISSFFSAI